MKENKTIVVSLDSGALITEFNEYAEKFTGYTRNEVIGRNWFEIFIPDADILEVLEAFNSLFHGENMFWKFENKITLKDGSKKQ